MAPVEITVENARRHPLQLVYSSPRARAGLLVAVGIAAIFLGTLGLDRESSWVRWPIALASLFLISNGIVRLLKQHFGPDFQASLWAARVWIVLVVLAAILAPLLPLQSPYALPLNVAPYIRPDLFSAHPLGTDGFGRDYLARLIYGSRVSLIVGIGGTAIGLLIGTVFGVAAGFYRGRIEAVVKVLTDSLLAFPPLIFMLALVAVLGPSLKTILIAVSFLAFPIVIRLTRAYTYRCMSQEYVTAARALGASSRRIILREVLPSMIGPLLSYSTILIANLIVVEASLSFLGLGINPPYPTWGNMIAASQTVLQQDPQTLLIPAVALFITVLAFYRVGDVSQRVQVGRVGKII